MAAAHTRLKLSSKKVESVHQKYERNIKMTRLWSKQIKLTFLSAEIEDSIKGNFCTQVQPTQSSILLRNKIMENNTILFGTGRLNVLLRNGFEQVSLWLILNLHLSFAFRRWGTLHLFLHTFICLLIAEVCATGRKVCTQQLEDKGKSKKKSVHVVENDAGLSNARLDLAPLGSQPSQAITIITAKLSTLGMNEDALSAADCCFKTQVYNELKWSVLSFFLHSGLDGHNEL